MNCLHSTLKPNPETRITSAPLLGIGLILPVGRYLLVNNIGCNLELSLPINGALDPLSFFVESNCPDDPDRSSFDLDMHALIYNPDRGQVIALNHDGLIRLFDMKDLSDDQRLSKQSTCLHPRRWLKPQSEMLWKGDVTHTFLIDDRLWSSSPLGYGCSDAAQPGLLISEPLTSCNGERAKRLECSVLMPELGFISSMAVDHQSQKLAIASGDKIYLGTTGRPYTGTFSFEHILWQSSVHFQTTFLAFHPDGILLAAGYDLGLVEDFTDPTNLIGGGYAVLNEGDGDILRMEAFKTNLAFGGGGQCLTLSRDSRHLIGIDRQAGLHSWEILGGLQQTLYEGQGQNSTGSLGIAHLAWSGDRLFCGFNRDSSYLHVYDLEAT